MPELFEMRMDLNYGMNDERLEPERLRIGSDAGVSQPGGLN
ncbi:MAG: hypothetical protein U9R58_07960 [Chloroflexota bacterium]|nr:hypothetical protein [Chloroflexota bacterium]